MTLKEIEFRIIPDSKTAYQLYKSKELDLLSGLPQEMIEKEKEIKNISVLQDSHLIFIRLM